MIELQRIQPEQAVHAPIIASIVPFIMRKRPTVSRLLEFYTVPELEAAIELMIDAVDWAHGDPDIETEMLEDDGTVPPISINFGPGCDIADAGEYAGDELDSTAAEDEMCPGLVRFRPSGPGCSISDPDFAVDDKGCDVELEGV